MNIVNNNVMLMSNNELKIEIKFKLFFEWNDKSLFT